VSLENLRVGDAHVDLQFERLGQRPRSVALTEAKIDGELDVVLDIPRALAAVAHRHPLAFAAAHVGLIYRWAHRHPTAPCC
jgi:hypothetical protein